MIKNILSTIIGFLSLGVAFIMLFSILSSPLKNTHQLTQSKKESNVFSSTNRLTNPYSALTRQFNIPPSSAFKTNNHNNSNPTPNTTYPTTTSNSTINWAGYVATNGQFSGISGSWTMPNVSANSNASELSADATWIGIGGVDSNDLIQTGTQNIVNSNGQVTSSAFYELLPNNSVTIPNFNVNPGDSITANLKYIGNNLWTINITNNTTNQTYSTTVSYDSSQSSAEWVEEDPSLSNGQIPLDNFNNVIFSNGSTIEDGNLLSISGSNATPVNMVNNQGRVLASASSLNNNGSGFSVSRTSANSSNSFSSYYQSNNYLNNNNFNQQNIGTNNLGGNNWSTSSRVIRLNIYYRHDHVYIN